MTLYTKLLAILCLFFFTKFIWSNTPDWRDIERLRNELEIVTDLNGTEIEKTDKVGVKSSSNLTPTTKRKEKDPRSPKVQEASKSGWKNLDAYFNPKP
jgi:hypothetical protein